MFRCRADENERKEKEIKEVHGGTLRTTPQSVSVCVCVVREIVTCECIKPMYLFADENMKLNAENEKLFGALKLAGRVTASRGIGASFCADQILLELSEKNMFRCHTGEDDEVPPMPKSTTPVAGRPLSSPRGRQ